MTEYENDVIKSIMNGEEVNLSSSRINILRILSVIFLLVVFFSRYLNRFSLLNQIINGSKTVNLILFIFAFILILLTFLTSSLRIKGKEIILKNLFSEQNYLISDIEKVNCFHLIPKKNGSTTFYTKVKLNTKGKKKTHYVLNKSRISKNHIVDPAFFLINLKHLTIKKYELR